MGRRKAESQAESCTFGNEMIHKEDCAVTKNNRFPAPTNK